MIAHSMFALSTMARNQKFVGLIYILPKVQNFAPMMQMPEKGNFKIQLTFASTCWDVRKLIRLDILAFTYQPLRKIGSWLGAQKINIAMDTWAVISIIPQKYLDGAVIYPTNISIYLLMNRRLNIQDKIH